MVSRQNIIKIKYLGTRPEKSEHLIAGRSHFLAKKCACAQIHIYYLLIKKYEKMIQKIGSMGIAIDNNCAIEFLGNSYRIISSRSYAQAFRVFKKNGRVISKKIPQKEALTPTATLFKMA